MSKISKDDWDRHALAGAARTRFFFAVPRTCHECGQTVYALADEPEPVVCGDCYAKQQRARAQNDEGGDDAGG